MTQTVPLHTQLQALYNGGAVQRFHTVRTVQRQTVADHSWGVASLLLLITNGNASRDLLAAALHHDLGEQWTGDVPSPTKRYATIGVQLAALEREQRLRAGLQEFKLSPAEEQLLDFTDNLDGMLFCLEEFKLGNRNAQLWFSRYSRYNDEHPALKVGCARDVYQVVHRAFLTAGGVYVTG